MTTRAISPRLPTAIAGVLLAGALLTGAPAGKAFADDADLAAPIQDMSHDVRADRAHVDNDRSRHDKRRLDRDRGRLDGDRDALDDLERG
jgi:hypothetical protein